jgi:hypothetical protein
MEKTEETACRAKHSNAASTPTERNTEYIDMGQFVTDYYENLYNKAKWICFYYGIKREDPYDICANFILKLLENSDNYKHLLNKNVIEAEKANGILYPKLYHLSIKHMKHHIIKKYDFEKSHLLIDEIIENKISVNDNKQYYLPDDIYNELRIKESESRKDCFLVPHETKVCNEKKYKKKIICDKAYISKSVVLHKNKYGHHSRVHYIVKLITDGKTRTKYLNSEEEALSFIKNNVKCTKERKQIHKYNYN